MSDTTIKVRSREKTGKNHNRRLRRRGGVPAVIYGGGVDSVAIEVENRKVDAILRASGENTIFLLQLEGTEESRHAMIRDIQFEPMTGGLIHLDFQRILMDKRIRVKVPIEIVGVPEGVKNEEGILDFVTRELEIECLPAEIPASLPLDVEGLHVGQHLEAGQVPLPEAATLVEEAERNVVSVSRSRVAEEVEVEEEEEDLIEAEEEEPEVISRGKEGEDGDTN